MQGVSAVVGNVGTASTVSTVGTIAARTTVQGAVQALMGGNFKDGAIAGLASDLAEAVSVNIKGGIEAALKDGSMTLAEAAAARTFTRVIGSAIRAAANPSDPGQAFASAFMDDVFSQIDLKRAVPPPDPFNTVRDDSEPTRRELIAEQLGVSVESIVDAGLFDDAGRSFDVLRGLIEGAGFSVIGIGDALIAIARVNSGDMRGAGQQLGKLTADLAQAIGGVEALTRLGVSAASPGGRLLLGAIDEIAQARQFASQAGRLPLGFGNAGKSEKFGSKLYAGLESIGAPEAKAGFQGSSVTGYRYRPPNEAFDVGRLSDFGVALASSELLQRAKDLGIGLRQQGVRTGPLLPYQIEQLGLSALQTELLAFAGRPINFMIFDSLDTVVVKAPTIRVLKSTKP